MTDAESCKRAVEAASEVISEEACQDGEFVSMDVGDGILAWIPEGALDHSPHSPETEGEIEEAIEACIHGDWARSWQNSVTGPDVADDIKRLTRERLCRGLYQ